MKNSMINYTPHVDPYRFERQFDAFRTFVAQKSGVDFVSFSNRYTDEQEGYKTDINHSGRTLLSFHAWTESDIGTGKIVDAVIAAIELPKNNLVPWHTRYGEEGRPHQPLFEAKNDQDVLQRIEEMLFRLYREERDERTFGELVGILGKTYPLLAYLFFLKDRFRYLPVAPRFFDRAFELLGADFKTSYRCSWKNYSAYVSLIGELRNMLAETLSVEVTLLHAHSFAWILACQMTQEGKLADLREYSNLTPSEREALCKARIGQGRFRQSLLEYWSTCAVTGCAEATLLKASHIKPWSRAETPERLSLYNGLLLSPSLDACFDAGYISFDDKGNILISTRLAKEDAKALGIHSDMRLRRVESQHKDYLAFHRDHVFK